MKVSVGIPDTIHSWGFLGGGWLDSIGQNPDWFDLEERVGVAIDLQETAVS